jgi:4-aminobutyrate aminotransferase-like enzyme
MTDERETGRPGPAILYQQGDLAGARDADDADLIRRRAAHLGGSMLFYRKAVHLVRGEGVWLFDRRGRRYLDCYNNVASVGHCHPRVVDALCRQARQLNTHTRYLHAEIVRYAERVVAMFPDGLDVCYFTCTGSEANELALRIARALTGRSGIVVMENAYHGNANLANEVSTCLPAPHGRPAYVAAVEPPNVYRGPFRDRERAGGQYAALAGDAVDALESQGAGLAAFLCDSIFDTQGTLEAPLDYFERVYTRVRASGGMCIADEVQAGLARTGNQMWGFGHYGVIPDIVTLGKPMGAGHPVAGVVTTREIAKEFSRRNVYFNTFGGNPVSAAVGNAVLDVMEEERLQENVCDVSAYLRRGLEELSQRHELIGDVRGRGLFFGIELVASRGTLEPAPAQATDVAERLLGEGILIGATGRHGNVIKVRPPLVFSRHDADFLLERLDAVLTTLETETGSLNA